MKRLVISALTLGFPLTLVPLFDTRRHWFFAECPLSVPSPREVYLGKRRCDVPRRARRIDAEVRVR